MITFQIESPMRRSHPGDYPVAPIVRVFVWSGARVLHESPHLMVDSEIDCFFNKMVFALKVLPSEVEAACEGVKRELELQRGRVVRGGS